MYTIEYYSDFKKKNISMKFTGKWMELKAIILSEETKGQKEKNCIFKVDFIKI